MKNLSNEQFGPYVFKKNYCLQEREPEMYEKMKIYNKKLEEWFIQIFQQYIDKEVQAYMESIIAENILHISLAQLISHFRAYCVLNNNELKKACDSDLVKEYEQIIDDNAIGFERILVLIRNTTMNQFQVVQTDDSINGDFTTCRYASQHTCFICIT